MKCQAQTSVCAPLSTTVSPLMSARDLSNTIVGGRVQDVSFGNIVGHDVTFDSCYVPPRAAGEWTTIRHVSLKDVVHINCDVNTTMFDDVLIDGIKRLGSSPLFLWGCAFKHVVLRGRIAGLKINRSIGPLSPKEEQRQWDDCVRELYDNTDWALDISNAKFPGGVSFEAIPGEKVRINNESQIRVRRDTLTRLGWENFDFAGSPIKLELSSFVRRSQFESGVLAARTDSKYAKEDIALFARMRDAGFMESAA